MAIEPISTATLGSLLGAIILFIVRERKKGKNEQSNNGDIKAIKKTTEANQKCLAKLDKGQGIISNDLKNMCLHCTETVSRFAKDISENRGDIKGILKDKKE